MPRWLKVTGIGCGGLILLVIVVAVLGIALSGPSVETADEGGEQAQQGNAEEGGPETVAIGEPLSVGDTAWIVSSAEQTDQLDDGLGGTETGNFIVVDFEFTNNSDEAITLDSTMLTLADSEGRENEPDTDKMFSIPEERDVFLEQVNPGVTKEGTVIFTVAPDASGFVMELAGGFFSGESGFVDLGF